MVETVPDTLLMVTVHVVLCPAARLLAPQVTPVACNWEVMAIWKSCVERLTKAAISDCSSLAMFPTVTVNVPVGDPVVSKIDVGVAASPLAVRMLT